MTGDASFSNRWGLRRDLVEEGTFKRRLESYLENNSPVRVGGKRKERLHPEAELRPL